MMSVLGIHGIGAVGDWGRGLAAFIQSETHPLSGVTGTDGRVARVMPDTLIDKVALKALRRADRFCKMAALAAWDAVAAAGSLVIDSGVLSTDNLGVIVTTALGPHRTTFTFLDDILDFGDAAVSPTTFSHSVHNAAAAYIAIMLGSRGPACTLTDFKQPLYAGMQTAAAWLSEGRCSHVLVGYAEESSGPLEAIAAALSSKAQITALQPFKLSSDPDAIISEGSVFLLVTLPENGGARFDAARLSGPERIADIGALRQHLA